MADRRSLRHRTHFFPKRHRPRPRFLRRLASVLMAALGGLVFIFVIYAGYGIIERRNVVARPDHGVSTTGRSANGAVPVVNSLTLKGVEDSMTSMD